MKEELFSGLTDEQKEKLKACRSPEELKELLENEKIEMSGEMLEAISGGCSCNDCWDSLGICY